MLRCCRMGAAAQGCILPSSERLLLPGHPAGGAWEVVRHRQVLLTVLLLLPSLACPPALPPFLPCPSLVSLPFPSFLVPTPAGHCLPLPPPLQIREELAAAEARRPAVIAAQPALRLNLPQALQQAPPRLDMCSVCARRLEQVGRVGWWCGSVWRRFSVRAQHGWRSEDHLHAASPESLPWLAWT